jgi:hypothetical protein
MMMPAFIVIMGVAVAVGSAFGLEGRLQLYELRAKAAEQILDYMVGSNADYLFSDISWQVSISQMPGKADELIGIFVPDFHDQLGCGLNLEPSPIIQLQAIAIGHGDGFRKVENDIFTLICGQANAAAMAGVEVEGK